MAGIFRSYFVDTKLVRAGRIAYLLFIILLVLPFFGEVSFAALFAAVPTGFIVCLGLETRLDRYFRVMPIKASKIILMRYLLNAAMFLMGTSLAVASVLIFSEDPVVRIHFIMLVFGVFLTVQGISNTMGNNFSSNQVLMVVIACLLYIIPFLQMYLVFGFSTVNHIISGRMSGIYITQSDAFADTNKFIVYVAVSIAVYIISYFAALRIYKNTDYRQVKISWY